MARSKKKHEHGPVEERPVYDPQPRRGGVMIPADDLRVGHVLLTGRSQVPVKSVEPCTGAWRTHLHVNRSDCYDGRLLVEVKRS